jgi:tRNA pseudouridine55 synthase
VVGVLNLDKPHGMSSAGAVARLRRSSGERRIGHAGTLDPAATGVLPLLFGRATLLADLVRAEGKAYRAEVRFGASSATDDAEGEIVPAPLSRPIDEAGVREALRGFEGRISQRPPAFSAVHVEGERSYRIAREAARSGSAPPEPAAREVEVHRLELRELLDAPEGPLARIEIECGSGFYVRSLARDLGEAMGTRAYLASLVRTRVGPFVIEGAMSLAAAEAAGAAMEHMLIPPAAVLGDLARVVVEGEDDLRHGREVPAPGQPEGAACAVDPAGRLLALGRIQGSRFRPHRLVEIG